MPQWWAYGLLFSVCSSVSCMIYCSICDHLCMYMYLRTIIYEPRCIPVWLRSLHIPLWYLCIYKCRSCIFYTALIFQPGTLYVKGCMQAGSAYFCSNWMGKWWQLVGKAAMKWMASDGLTFCLLRCGTSSVLTFLCSHYFNRYTYNWLCFGFVAVSTAAIGDSNQVLPRTATTKHTTTTTTTTNTPASSSSTVTSTTPTATATATYCYSYCYCCGRRRPLTPSWGDSCLGMFNREPFATTLGPDTVVHVHGPLLLRCWGAKASQELEPGSRYGNQDWRAGFWRLSMSPNLFEIKAVLTEMVLNYCAQSLRVLKTFGPWRSLFQEVDTLDLLLYTTSMVVRAVSSMLTDWCMEPNLSKRRY